MSLTLPGTGGVPAAAAIRAHRGELGKLVDLDAALETARLTAAALAAAPALADELRDIVGLGGRERPRRSPLALRVLLLAAEGGHLASHDDLREPMPLAADQLPGPLPHRFQTFHQEAVMAGAPARTGKASKWDVHHLWHAVQGLLWDPGFTRGDLYAGVRLDEAVCEAHWYHLDEVLGARCPEHVRPDLARVGPETWPECRECDTSGQPDEAGGPGGALARDLIRGGVRFWDSEVASVDLLGQTGRLAPNPLTGGVPNWKDAFEYVEAHERRLLSAAFRRHAERALVDGVDRTRDLAAYRDAIAARLARLLLAEVQVDLCRARAARGRRVLQDAHARLVQEAYLDPPGPAAAGVEAAVGDVEAALAAVTPVALADGPASPDEADGAAGAAWRGLLAAAARPGTERPLTLGYDLRRALGQPPEGPAGSPPGERLVRDGLLLRYLAERAERELPLTTRAARALGKPESLARMLREGAAFAGGRRRLATQAPEALVGDPPLRDVARFEAALADLERAPVAMHEELFALSVAGDAPVADATRVRVNPSLTRLELEHDACAFRSGAALARGRAVVWLGSHRGERIAARADDLDPLHAALRTPRPLGEVVGANGPLAGRRERALELLRLGLLVAVRRPT